MTRPYISPEDRSRLTEARYGHVDPKIYKVRVRWTKDQGRIEAQAAMLGFKAPEEFIFRCALLVTERLEAWRDLCQDDGRENER